ncbi:hypothetical protein BGZ83_003719 [Gryganskiella cystojenkinii]|nr:hypothetical protein BGZ83_003719 [Gryganskiella cystojenkinii]
MADSDSFKEPPPKPMRIRPQTNINGSSVNEIKENFSKSPVPSPRPSPRPAKQDLDTIADQPCTRQPYDISSSRLTREESPVKKDLSSSSTLENSGEPVVSSAASPKTASRQAPQPPPKPKRISLAPQPKAKPLALQSSALQPKPDHALDIADSNNVSELASDMESLVPAASLSAPSSSTASSIRTTSLAERLQDVSKSQELPQSTGETVKSVGFKPLNGVNGGGVGYRPHTDDTPPQAAVALTASLHKIQALAQEQTERMKQINYAEKRADLAEAVQEKSSLWKARGVEWGGIAKKAWEDRGGMGGIAGGLADRWKRRDMDDVPDSFGKFTRRGTADHIFGLPLEEAFRLSRISVVTGVPAVVTRCIEYLDIMGVEEVGLYRVSGSTTNVARLKSMFDHGLDYDFLQKGNEPQNPHDVATLLKLYLRELPSPIIPTESLPTFNSIKFSDTDQSHQLLRDALHRLPLENYILLGTLCQHLSNLADYETSTKMNISNLGLIFCPTLQIGSVLFKNLLGGDGGHDSRRKNLLFVWSDKDMKHEEMENLEMIKNFEMGLKVEHNGESEFDFTDDFVQGGGDSPKVSHTDHHHQKQHHRHPREAAATFQRPHDDWEEIDRDQADHIPATPPHTHRHLKGGSGSKQAQLLSSPTATNASTYTQHQQMSTTGSPSSRPVPQAPVLDLYDQLMTKELNEATSTPLIDFGVDDDGPSDQLDAMRWRRHAREPAINNNNDTNGNGASRSDGQQPSRTRHERYPAASLI